MNAAADLSPAPTPSALRPVLLLGIETATDVCSVALLEGEDVVAELAVEEPRSHAARLVPLIQRLLLDRGRSPSDLDIIGVSAGPGSYTGLRIGASTAKGLAFAADAALVAVPSLEALASLAPTEPERPILAVFPSRRGEVYAAIYQVAAEGLVPILEPSAVDLAEMDTWLPQGELYVLGSASGVVKEAISEPDRLFLVKAAPSAASVATLALKRFGNGQTENVAAWEPYYLNEFIARPPRPIFG